MFHERSRHALPLEMPTHILRVQLHFEVTAEGPRFVLEGQDGGNDEIVVPPGLCLIVLALTRESNAAFLTHPLSWFARDLTTPDRVPDPINVRREHGTLLTLLDHNPGEVEQRFHFRISLASGGEVFTSPDPTIINRKPYGYVC